MPHNGARTTSELRSKAGCTSERAIDGAQWGDERAGTMAGQLRRASLCPLVCIVFVVRSFLPLVCCDCAGKTQGRFSLSSLSSAAMGDDVREDDIVLAI